jgi:hypothetical protein
MSVATLIAGPNGAYYALLPDGRLLTAATFSASGDDVPFLFYVVRT